MTNQKTPMSAQELYDAITLELYFGEWEAEEAIRIIHQRDQQLTAAKDAEIAALHEVINMKDRLREELQAKLAKMRETLSDIAMCNMPRRCLDCHANARNALTEPTQGETPCK